VDGPLCLLLTADTGCRVKRPLAECALAVTEDGARLVRTAPALGGRAPCSVAALPAIPSVRTAAAVPAAPSRVSVRACSNVFLFIFFPVSLVPTDRAADCVHAEWEGTTCLGAELAGCGCGSCGRSHSEPHARACRCPSGVWCVVLLAKSACYRP